MDCRDDKNLLMDFLRMFAKRFLILKFGSICFLETGDSISVRRAHF